MKPLCILILPLALVAHAGAQTAQEKSLPPLPPGPLIAKVEKGTWTVSVTAGQLSPSTLGKAPQTAPAEKWTTAKDGKLLAMSGTDFIGPFVRWVCPDGQFIKRDGAAIFMLDSTELPTGEAVSYAGSDFPECRWIKRSDYSGVQSMGGKNSYYVFVNKEPVQHPFETVDPPGSLVCYVDQKSHLPVLLIQGNRTFNYEYSLDSVQQLTLPSEIENLLMVLKKRFQELQRRNGKA